MLAPARNRKQVPGPHEAPAAMVLLAPFLEDCRVIHLNNVRELDHWSKMALIHEDHTIAVKYRHCAHAEVNRTGAWTKEKKGQPARVGMTDSFIQFSPGSHSPVNVHDKMPHENAHKTSAKTFIKVPRRPNRSDPSTPSAAFRPAMKKGTPCTEFA